MVSVSASYSPKRQQRNSQGRGLGVSSSNPQSTPPGGVRKVKAKAKAKATTPLRRSARLKSLLYEYTDQTPARPQNRSRETESLSIETAPGPPTERLRKAATRPTRRDYDLRSAETPIDPIDHWRTHQRWPKEYFESDTMRHALARKKSTASLRRKRSDSGSLAASSTTPSDQKPREEKSAPYRDARYETLLATKDSFMDTSEQGIVNASKAQCLALLEKEQDVPQQSLFRDDLFVSTCRKIRNRNETRVIRDISQLIVPSAETLTTYGAKELEILIESTNEGWNNSIPLTGTRPQPDYSVGFKRDAFSKDQLQKLAPFIGDFLTGDQSFFMATYYMYFPFLTSEVKCGAAALDIADRQNAHSMTLAVRGVVELFRLVKCEDKINREILAFSVSHDHRSVRMYGHYAVLDGPKTTYYRHPIRTFDFTELDGKEKWTAYKFIKSVYDTWMPAHFNRLCAAIDELPSELDFGVLPLPQDSGLSQSLQSHHLSGSFAESRSQTVDSDAEVVTPNTSFTEQRSRKSRRKAAN